MKINKFLMLALAAVTFFTSCTSDDDVNEIPEERGDYANGIFVLNEGNFNSGNSTVSFVDENLEEITHSIFSLENSGAALGDTGQSMGFYEDYAFIVVNVSNKIEVVDRNTFERIATIETGLENPRYIAFSNGHAYVTNWGDGENPDDDYVAVIDAVGFEVVENISVVDGPERIISGDEMIYVAHAGRTTQNNRISVIDAGTNSVTEMLTVGDVPNDLEIEDGHLWVTSGGIPAWTGMETAGRISKISLASYETVQEYNFPDATYHPANLEIENGLVYYTLGNAVYTFNENEESLPESEFMVLDEVEILNGFEVRNNRIYAVSTNSSYTGDGDLYVYDATSGSLIAPFETGINPNGVYFNE